MRLSTSLSSFVVGLAVFTTTGCISNYRSERNFQPSPNGQFVVSDVAHHTSLQIPAPEEMELSSKVSVRVRDSKGKELFTVPVAKARQSYQTGYGRVSTVWSPDSKMVAYCNQGNLSVVEITSSKPKELLQSVSSFRWVGTSNLCCISGPSGRGGQLCVNEISSCGEVGASKTFDFTVLGFNSIASEECRELSPDSRHLVFMDGAQILVQNLKGTTNQAVLQRKLYPGDCWWTDSGDKCLLSGLDTDKTTKAWPEDTAFRNVVYLYETKSASLRDISELLRQLNPTNFLNPMPSVEGRIWSPQGNWFLVSGPGDWVCIPEPWSFVCLQKILNPNLRSPKIAPSGSRIAMVSVSTPYAEKGDLFVAEIRVGASGKISVGIPQKIVAGIPAYSWFWSADGKELIVWTGRKFIHHSIPTQP